MILKNIIENYKNNIKVIIKNITGQDNEDIEQEVYIRAWKNSDRYNEIGRFKGWINKITVNICRDYLKSLEFKQFKMVRLEDDSVSELKDTKECPESKFVSKQRQKTILDAINRLKPKYKEVIVLYEMKQLDYDEISKILKCPVGTVKSRLFNARKELSSTLIDLI